MPVIHPEQQPDLAAVAFAGLVLVVIIAMFDGCFKAIQTHLGG